MHAHLKHGIFAACFIAFPQSILKSKKCLIYTQSIRDSSEDLWRIQIVLEANEAANTARVYEDTADNYSQNSALENALK